MTEWTLSWDALDLWQQVLGILNFSRFMLGAKPWLVEPPLLEMPWNRDVADGKGLPPELSISILWDDGVVP
jgi:hypothetical protein